MNLSLPRTETSLSGAYVLLEMPTPFDAPSLLAKAPSGGKPQSAQFGNPYAGTGFKLSLEGPHAGQSIDTIYTRPVGTIGRKAAQELTEIGKRRGFTVDT
jgi:hypothetical protein